MVTEVIWKPKESEWERDDIQGAEMLWGHSEAYLRGPRRLHSHMRTWHGGVTTWHVAQQPAPYPARAGGSLSALQQEVDLAQ